MACREECEHRPSGEQAQERACDGDHHQHDHQGHPRPRRIHDGCHSGGSRAKERHQESSYEVTGDRDRYEGQHDAAVHAPNRAPFGSSQRSVDQSDLSQNAGSWRGEGYLARMKWRVLVAAAIFGFVMVLGRSWGTVPVALVAASLTFVHAWADEIRTRR